MQTPASKTFQVSLGVSLRFSTFSCQRSVKIKSQSFFHSQGKVDMRIYVCMWMYCGTWLAYEIASIVLLELNGYLNMHLYLCIYTHIYTLI